MRHGISILAVGHASSLFLAITFSVCVAFDLLFPGMAMYETWLKLLPGFEWLSWKSFLIGLAESYGYGWYFALIWVPLYNLVILRQAARRVSSSTASAWTRNQE